MAFINYKNREIQFKIVYYGPSFCGKWSSLRNLHALIDPELRSDFETTLLGEDRLSSFQFQGQALETVEGFRSRFQLLTLPGFPSNPDSHRQILKGVDGVVILIDSQWDRMVENVQAISSLQENLVQNHLSLAQIPHLFQFNKRDLTTAAPMTYLEYTFNNRLKRVQCFETQAHLGSGVVEALDAMVRMVLAKYSKNPDSGSGSIPLPG